MISRNFWYDRHDLPLRGINFEPYRTVFIKTATPVGVAAFMVRPTRFERATYRVGVCHSIQLSYERVLRFKTRSYYSKYFGACKAKADEKLTFFRFGCKARRLQEQTPGFCCALQIRTWLRLSTCRRPCLPVQRQLPSRRPPADRACRRPEIRSSGRRKRWTRRSPAQFS